MEETGGATLNYSYTISKTRRSMTLEKDFYNFSLYVTEKGPNGKVEWDIQRLKGSDPVNQTNFFNSFLRTREWVVKNHPELLL